MWDGGDHNCSGFMKLTRQPTVAIYHNSHIFLLHSYVSYMCHSLAIANGVMHDSH